MLEPKLPLNTYVRVCCFDVPFYHQMPFYSSRSFLFSDVWCFCTFVHFLFSFWEINPYIFSSSPPCWFVIGSGVFMWRHAPPTCPLVSRLQWAALWHLWVWARPPQAFQSPAGCTGAFPGQVPSTTCVPPAVAPSRKLRCSLFLLPCIVLWSANIN